MKITNTHPLNLYPNINRLTGQVGIPATFRQLQNQANRSLALLESELENFFGPTALWANPNTSSIARSFFTYDVEKTQEGYKLMIEVPGLSEADLEIEAKDNILNIKGEKELKNKSTKAQSQTPENTKDAALSDQEQERITKIQKNLDCTFTLPEEANTDKITARLEHGVLEITIPLQEKTVDIGKRIAINT